MAVANIKKRLTVVLLTKIAPILENNRHLYSIKESTESELYLIDKDPNSDFHFEIRKESSDKNGHYVECACKPWSSLSNTATSNTFKLEDFLIHFTTWFENLSIYNAETVLDDPILKTYEDEFYQDFKLADENADKKPFDYVQQIRLSQYLETVINNIDNFKDEQNLPSIDDIKNDAEQLKQCLTSETQNSIMRRLSRIWAKGRKVSLKISNFMMREFAKEFIKDGAKILFIWGISNAHKIPEYYNYIVHHLPVIN